MILETDALAAKYDGDILARRNALRHFGRRCVSRDHGFRLIMIAGGRGEHETAIADRIIEAVVKYSPVKNSVGARRHHTGSFVGPSFLRLHQTQPRQAEIRHRAGRRTDVLAKLWLDQNDDRCRRFDPALGFVRPGTRHCSPPY